MHATHKSQKRIFIHIGLHKTGTTAIQNWFAKNQDTISNEGVLYPKPYASQNNPGHHYLGALTSLDHTQQPEHKNSKHLHTLFRNIYDSDASRILISSELLSLAYPEKVFEIFSDFECEIIVILRRQDEYIESMFRELTKSSFFQGMPQTFLDRALNGDPFTIFTDGRKRHLEAPLPIHFYDLLENWGSVFGEERIHPLIYDDINTGRDAVGKIQNILNLPVTGADRTSPHNLSFSASTVAAKALLDPHLTWSTKMALRPSISRANKEVSIAGPAVIFGKKDRKKIMKTVARSNRRVAERYVSPKRAPWLTAPKVQACEAAPSINKVSIAKFSSFLIEEIINKNDDNVNNFREYQNITFGENPEDTYTPPPRGTERKISRPSHFGFGLNFMGVAELVQNPKDLEIYFRTLEEIGANVIRVPFTWRRFARQFNNGRNCTLDPSEKLEAQILRFLELIPDRIRVLAFIVKAPPVIAADYYYDQSTLTEQYIQFIDYVISTYRKIQDIELWNEPNASDFYLSVRTPSGGHRPWSAAEYRRDILDPAVQHLRRRDFQGKVVGATFAENGLVGHSDGRLPLANSINGHPDFADEMDRNRTGESFYFQPDFARDLLAELKHDYKDSSSLPFDAFAVHPYPYFDTAQKPFADHAVDLVKEFIDLRNEFGFEGTPVWATEVGCRALNLHQDYAADAKAQAEFVPHFIQGSVNSGMLDRVYWYKFNDARWDLIQEKTFGIFDHNTQKRPIYYELKSVLGSVRPQNVLPTLIDDFDYACLHEAGAVDPDFWELSKSKEFGYLLGTPGGSGSSPHVLVYPGRHKNDWLILTTRYFLAPHESGKLCIDVGVQLNVDLTANDTVVDFTLLIWSRATSDEPCQLCLTIDLFNDRVTAAWHEHSEVLWENYVIEGLSARTFRGARLKRTGDRIVFLGWGDEGWSKEVDVCDQLRLHPERALGFGLSFQRKSGGYAFLDLTGFRADRGYRPDVRARQAEQ